MQWLWSLFGWTPPDERPPDDREAFARREADLKRRFERLDQEADVIQRTHGREEPDA